LRQVFSPIDFEANINGLEVSAKWPEDPALKVLVVHDVFWYGDLVSL